MLGATHVDLANAFWSLKLPQEFRSSLHLKFEGRHVAIFRVSFGWKYSPILCQRVLAYFLASLPSGGRLVLHYLDEFMVLGRERGSVREVTMEWAQVLEDKGFIVSAKSALEPTQQLKWLGKDFDLHGGHIDNVDGATDITLAKWLRFALGPCTRARTRNILGKFRWLARPYTILGPFLASTQSTFNLPL